MDEAFLLFSQLLDLTRALPGELVDNDAGVRSHIYACELEMPLELNIGRDSDGKLFLGATPPLYYTETSFLPSFHKIKILIEADDQDYEE
jgi:hypothetical protein